MDITIETPDGLEFEVTLTGDLVPYTPVKISGPPEQCYPAEGGYVEDMIATVYCGPSTDGSFNAVEMDEYELAEFMGSWDSVELLSERLYEYMAEIKNDELSAWDEWKMEQKLDRLRDADEN